MESLKRLHFISALLGLIWKGEGTTNRCRSHRAFITLSCSLGERAVRHRSAAGPLFQGHILCPLRVSPPTNVPPLRWCDERGLLRPSMKEVLVHLALVQEPSGRVCRGAMASHAPSHPIPGHLPPPQNPCSTAKVAFLFIYWNNYSATTKIGWIFQELWMVARVCNYESLGILWRWMQAGHYSLEVLKSSIKGV